MSASPKLRIGLFGANGHQLNHLIENPHPLAEVTAVCGIKWPCAPRKEIREVATLDELLKTDVDLISLCSPFRSEQAEHAIRCLDAGKHVFAEKPAVLLESDLDKILKTAERTGFSFREMGGTVWGQPWLTMREIVLRGDIGEVVQVFAQKSYPYYPDRPQDELVDGGLFLQNGIHAARFIEHITGQRLVSVQGVETGLGNPEVGGLRMATAFQGMLENGGCASAIANYLNPRGFGHWGNEAVRVFGSKGMIEAVDSGTKTRLVIGEKDFGPLQLGAECDSYFTLYVRMLLGLGELPFSIEEELHPLRVLLRAKQFAK